MKTTIDKSIVMKRAWQIYKMENMPMNSRFRRGKFTFSMALKRAWKKEKQEVAMNNQPKKVIRTVETFGFGNAIIESYNNARPGAYFGD